MHGHGQRGEDRTEPGGLLGEGAHPPRPGVDRRDVASQGRERARLTEAGDGAVHDRSVQRLGAGGVDPPPRGPPGWPRHHHDVGGSSEPMEAFDARFAMQIEGDAALAAQPQWAGGKRPETIARGWLDLHDVGAKVGEHHRGEAANGPRRGVEYADAIERSDHDADRTPATPAARNG